MNTVDNDLGAYPVSSDSSLARISLPAAANTNSTAAACGTGWPRTATSRPHTDNTTSGTSTGSSTTAGSSPTGPLTQVGGATP